MPQSIENLKSKIEKLRPLGRPLRFCEKLADGFGGGKGEDAPGAGVLEGMGALG